MRKRVVVPAAATALLLVAAGVLAWRLATPPSAYQQALAWLPESTLRASYTDWEKVRALSGGTTVGPASSAADVDRFLDRAYDLDLSAISAVSESTSVLADEYGFSPLDARWEIFGQSRQGAVDVIALPDQADPAGIERNLRTLGYAPPGEQTPDVWRGSADLVSALDATLSSLQHNVAVLADQRVVLMSDSASYLTGAVAVVRGSAAGLDAVPRVAELAGVVSSPVSATLWAADFACADLAMSAADEEDQRVGEDLVAAAGGVSPLTGLAMARGTAETLVVAMAYESPEQAAADLQPRVDLASGDAPGQGGSFADRFMLTSARAEDATVVLHLRPRSRAAAVLSDISVGPVLFATC